MKNLARHLTIASLGLIPACVHMTPPSAPAEATSAKKKNETAMYVFESDGNGFNTKTVFFDTGKEVVAFDAQFTSDAAKKAIAFLRSKSAHPITHLVITHPNPDKFNGAEVFRQAGAKIVASQATANALEGVHAYKKYFFVNIAKMFTEQSYPALVSPDITFGEKLTLTTSAGTEIVLREIGKPGVSANQTVAFIPEKNALVVGDLVHHKAHAWLEGGIEAGKATPHLREWKDVLKALRSEYGSKGTLVYGGRGEVALANEAFNDQVRYLEMAEQIVKGFVLSHKDALKTNPQAAYAELTKAFEAEFPSYKLPYMITYGAYGLVDNLSASR
jgi:glyoxylase-like metal-dependent hydrolase (beta-lactamase superfamily II)